MSSSVILANLALAALKKPLEDAYGLATGAIKGTLQRWAANEARQAIALKIEEVELVRTIFKSDMVRLSTFYYPSRVRSMSPSAQPRAATTLDELSPRENILLYGTVGQGKSMFMRNLCAWELREGNRIPIFIELRNIDDKNGILSLIRSSMQMLGFDGLTDDILDFLLSNAGFSIFLDGFDEIKRQFAFLCYQDFHKLTVKYPSTRWVVSSRPGGVATSLQAIPGVLRLSLCGLVDTDFDPFLEKLGVDDVHRGKLLEAIRTSSTDVKGVLTTPLMLTLLKETFGVSANIPDNLHDFYEALFNVLAWRHDDIKDMYQRERATSLSNSELQESFEAFSFLSKEHGVSLTDAQFAKCAKDASRLIDKAFTPDGLKGDLTNVVCLMVPDGLRTAFIHKSIQEFFAAFFIKDFTKTELVAKFYGALRQQKLTTWAQEINFLEKLDHDRYVEYFVLPGINEFLREISYDETSRVGLTKNHLFRFLKKLSLFCLEPDSGRDLMYFVFSVDSPFFNATTQRFVQDCFPLPQLIIFTGDVVESIEKSSELKIIKFDSYLKGQQALANSILRRARDFCERSNREKKRYEKNIATRKSDVAKIFLGNGERRR